MSDRLDNPHGIGRFGAFALCLLMLVAGATEAAETMRVTLLGTGGPHYTNGRFQNSTLVQAGNQILLFDAGNAAVVRLTETDVDVGAVDTLFLTHLHSDHILALPDLWLTGYLKRRAEPLTVYGPEGVDALTAGLEDAFAYDVGVRTANAPQRAKAIELRSKIVSEGVVYERGGVTVTAFLVDHFDVKPAYGYRIDYDNRSVVISGDTRYNENVIEQATGADLLIHEVAAISDTMKKKLPVMNKVEALHTTPNQAGEVFAKAQPRIAAYSHIVLIGEDERDLVRRTRQTYNGPLIVGNDLMSFEISERGVTVIGPQ